MGACHILAKKNLLRTRRMSKEYDVHKIITKSFCGNEPDKKVLYIVYSSRCILS